jgi:3-oxoacyl-[acyl-carrier protein] reductase
MKNLALELSQYDIRVNSITPGFIDTKLTRNNLSKEDIVKLETRIPLKRLGNVKDISNMALYLCSEKASYLTGQDITIDGGFIAGGFFENN